MKEEIISPIFHQYETILHKSQLEKWTKKIKKASIFSFDLKIDNFENLSSDLIGISFSVGSGLAAYIPIKHNYLNVPRQLQKNQVIKELKLFFENRKISKVGQNLKLNYSILKKNNIDLRGTIFDTKIESYILNNFLIKKDIDFLSQYWLKYKTLFFKDKEKQNRKKISFSQINLEKAGIYAAETADVILRLHNCMWMELQKKKNLLNIFQNIEMPLVYVLSRMENKGVKIDLKKLDKLSKEVTSQLEKVKKNAYRIVGKSFNLSSVRELKTILFEKKNVQFLEEISGETFSTSKRILRKLALNHPLPKIILEYRKLNKIKSTYTDRLPLIVNSKTRRVHTSYNQEATITGRLSSSSPNLQNIPTCNRKGKNIRQIFIAPRGYFIFSADYSQIELRIMAHLSKDKELLEVFHENRDIHRITASEIFSLPENDVTKEQRKKAKAINFGLMYGISAFGLSRQLDISYEESKRYICTCLNRYSGVVDYITLTRKQAREYGYVETLNGRRIYLPEIKSKNHVNRASAERTAINAPIQGTAADIIKLAMIAIDRWLKKKQIRACMIMQVHDELIFEVHKNDVETISKKISDIMENIIKLSVPLRIETSSGKNWGELTKVSNY